MDNETTKKRKRCRIKHATITPSVRAAHYSSKYKGGRRPKSLGPPVPLFGPVVHGIARRRTNPSATNSTGVNTASTSLILPDADQVEVGRQRNRGKYKENKKQEVSAWFNLRKLLMETSVGMQARPDGAVCRICRAEDVTLYRCTDCQPMLMCRPCLVNEHPVQRLHVVEQWQGEYFMPVEIEEFKYLGPITCVGEPAKRLLTLIDHKGRTHVNCTVLFAGTEGGVEALVRHGFWPLTPTHPKVAVSMALLDTLVCLTLEAQVSVQGFVSAMELNNPQSMSRLNHLRRGECVAEYRIYWQMMRDAPQSLMLPADMDITCPACPKEVGSLDLALDANFGLVHKKNSGTTYSESPLAKRFFVDQGEVDTFVTTYSNDMHRPEQDCSQFQAARAIRTKNKATNLTVTGVFGSVCRHEVPYQFADMRHGERLGYSVFLIRHAVKRIEGTGIQLRVLYDIACILKSHLQKWGQDILAKISLAIPIFHAYGHRGECQVLMNPRRMQGFGLTDGEQLERLWSYLRLFAKITKEQTPGHRRDLLVMALSHYASTKIQNIAQQLVDKMKKAGRTAEVAEEKATKLFLEYHESVGGHRTPNEELVACWESEEKKILMQKKLLRTAERTSWQDAYVTDLVQFYALRSRLQASSMAVESSEDTTLLCQQLTQLEQTLLFMEKKHRIGRWEPGSNEMKQHQDKLESQQKSKIIFKMRALAVEKEFLLGLMKKYSSDGQAVANRLSTQLKRVTASLRASAQQYNRSGFSAQSIPYPNTVSYDDISRPTAQVYADLEEQLTGSDHPRASAVSSGCRRQLLDTVSLQTRAEEERERLRLEMLHTYKFYCTKFVCAQEQSASISPSSQYLQGMQSLYALKQDHLKSHLSRLATAFTPYVVLPDPPVDTSALEQEPPISDVSSEDESDVGLESPEEGSESEWVIELPDP